MITAEVYEQIRRKRPELKLPPWRMLRKSARKLAKRMDAREFIGKRTARLLAGADDHPGDRLRGGHLWPPMSGREWERAQRF